MPTPKHGRVCMFHNHAQHGTLQCKSLLGQIPGMIWHQYRASCLESSLWGGPSVLPPHLGVLSGQRCSVVAAGSALSLLQQQQPTVAIGGCESKEQVIILT